MKSPQLGLIGVLGLCLLTLSAAFHGGHHLLTKHPLPAPSVRPQCLDFPWYILGQEVLGWGAQVEQENDNHDELYGHMAPLHPLSSLTGRWCKYTCHPCFTGEETESQRS